MKKNKNKNSFFSSFKGNTPIEIRDKKDFCKLVKKDRDTAEEILAMTVTPFAYDYVEGKVDKAESIKDIVKKAIKKAIKKIEDFKEDKEENLEDWCTNFLDKELKRNK